MCSKCVLINNVLKLAFMQKKRKMSLYFTAKFSGAKSFPAT